MLPAIGPLDPKPTAVADPARSDEKIREIAVEFEAVLVSAMLKEGLKSASQTGLDGEESGGSTYMEVTCEQLAHFIGRQGLLGIADQIVDSLQQQR